MEMEMEVCDRVVRVYPGGTGRYIYIDVIVDGVETELRIHRATGEVAIWNGVADYDPIPVASK